MKNSFTVKTAFLAAAALALSIAPPCLTAQTAASPKQRIEQEFRQLETNLTRYVHSTVLNAPNLDSMNRALDGFMRENAGVKRILRTNAGGFTVNDVSSGQPHSAPSRNVSSQRWLQTLTQSKSPYYSSSVDSAGALTLFYAWPIMSGPDKSHFSGAFAARIDFTTVVALIENIAPFQLALGGRAFLQHEWDGVDYNEEPLGVRGAQDITIRTVKPLATRQTPRNSPSPSVPVVVVSEAGAVTLSAEDPALTPAAEAQSGSAAGKNTDVLLKSSVQLIMALIVMVVAVMLVIVIFRVRRHSSRAEGRFFMEEETYFVDKKSEPAPAPQPPSEPRREPSTGIRLELVDTAALPPQPVVASETKENAPDKSDPAVKVEKNVDPRDIALAQFLKGEFGKMDKKIQALSKRIDRLESDKSK